jgi:hypothetical protein
LGKEQFERLRDPDRSGRGLRRQNLQRRSFSANIEQQKLLKGGRNADPFVIAKAATDGKTVVTMELLKANAAKIPNICKHFQIPCMTLEQFMEAEGWEF